jgi:adenylate cyclase
MLGLLSRRRYELVAIAVALVCSFLHLRSSTLPAIGLVRDASSDPVARGILLIEARATDLKFRMRGPIDPHPAIVVVAIDEKSAQKYGLWPWPRHRMAKAIEHMVDAGAKAIGLDMVFTDATVDEGKAFRDLLQRFDAASPKEPGALADFRRELESKGAGTSADDALAAALKRAGPRLVQGTVGYTPEDEKDFTAEKIAEQVKELDGLVIRTMPGPAGTTLELPIDKIQGYPMRSAQTPLPIFAAAGNSLGHFNYVPDVDGTVRRTPALIKLSRPLGYLPSMPVRAAAIWLNARIVPQWDRGEDKLTSIELRTDDQKIVWPYEENEAFALINYAGPGNVFKTVSIADVIDGTFDPAALQDKLVLVGVTMVGDASSDLRVTPFKEAEPGIFTHASVASALLQNKLLSRPQRMVPIEMLAMLLMAVGLAASIPRLKSFALKLAIIFGLAAAWLLVDLWTFAAGTQIATVMPLTNVLATSFSLIFLGYLSVDREKLKLRNTFTRYLGEDVMEEALKNPDKLNQGEKRDMTVLFSDIRGFTTLSERMLPEKLASFINEYLSPMTRIVFEEKGTLDKYIGDAVMAFWNAPLDQPDHAVRACRAAWAMLQKLEELKVKWRSENYPEFDIGVGINTGPMIVGNMGSDVRVDYTVMGDAVNLASRLEGTNKEYETRVIVGEGTYPHVKDQIILRRLGAVRVKGKRKPVRIYELRGVGKAQGPEAEAIAKFDEGLDAYVEQKWDVSEAAFRRVMELWPNDPPARRYLEEIPQLRANPPGQGWDGVYTATHK